MRRIILVFSALSRLVLIVGILLFIPVFVALFFEEYDLIWHFIVPGSLATALGLITTSFTHFSLRKITIVEAMVISALGWIVVSAIGAIPYVTIINMDYVDAYFETMSGFTTTGMTLIKTIETTPKSLLFWRAFTQWVGGVGIMLFFIIVFASAGAAGLWRLYLAEAREDRLTISAWVTVKYIWMIYFLYTALCAFLLWLAGMTPYEAITHSFTVLSTGGFSTRTLSIAAFHNLKIEAIMILFMFIGGVSFLAHYILFTRGFKAFIRHFEVKAMAAIVAIATALVVMDLTLNNITDVFNGVRYALFQVVSIMTTTGYTTTDMNKWPPLSKMVITALMFIGGNAGSTAGAIKVGRIVIMLKLIWHEISKLSLPRGAEKPFRIGGRILEESDILRVGGFVAAYFILYLIEVGIVTFRGYPVFSALSGVASAQGNVGPAFISLFELDKISKTVLIIGMWAGRLEVIPVLFLFSPNTWKMLFEQISKEEIKY